MLINDIVVRQMFIRPVQAPLSVRIVNLIGLGGVQGMLGF